MIKKTHILWFFLGFSFYAHITWAMTGGDGKVTGFDPIRSFGQVYYNNYTLQDQINSLLNQKANLKTQLDNVTQQLSSLQQLSKAQDSLHLTWTPAKAGNSAQNALNVDTGNGQKIQLCHTQYQGGVHPGVLVKEGCRITFAGDMVMVPTYEVLTGQVRTHWANIDINQYQRMENNISLWNQKSFPIQGGFENRAPLFICKAIIDGRNYFGKMIGNFCDVAIDKLELPIKDPKQYQVLFADTNS